MYTYVVRKETPTDTVIDWIKFDQNEMKFSWYQDSRQFEDFYSIDLIGYILSLYGNV